MDSEEVVKGSCFWAHKWTKWKDLAKVTYTYRYASGAAYKREERLVQERRCIRCNHLNTQEVYLKDLAIATSK